jgi:hypothetical protein
MHSTPGKKAQKKRGRQQKGSGDCAEVDLRRNGAEPWHPRLPKLREGIAVLATVLGGSGDPDQTYSALVE